MAFQIFDLPAPERFGTTVVWPNSLIAFPIDAVLSVVNNAILAYIRVDVDDSVLEVRTRPADEFFTILPGPEFSDGVKNNGFVMLQIDDISILIDDLSTDPDQEEPYDFPITALVAQEIIDYYRDNVPNIQRFVIWDGAGPNPLLPLPPAQLDPQLVLEYSEALGLYKKRGSVILQDSALEEDSPEEIIAVLLRANLPTGDINVWTGTPNLIFEGNEYVASRILEVSSLGNTSDLNSNSRSIRITLSSITPENRSVFLNPVGLARIRLRTLTSQDSGITWRKIGQEIVGVISSPVLTGSTYTFEIEPRNALVDRARLIYWSHEDRVRRVGAQDQGMSQMPKLSDEGILGRWPNP